MIPSTAEAFATSAPTQRRAARAPPEQRATTVEPPAPQTAPPRPAPAGPRRAAFPLEGFIAAQMHLMVQLWSLRSCSSAGEALQRLASVAAAQAFWLPAVLCERWFELYREPLFACTRLLIWAMPNARQDLGVQKLLSTAPTPGVAGAAYDLWRLVIGTRLLGIAMAALGAPIALLPHLAVQAASLALARRNATICASPLLTAPLSRRRVRALHAWLELAFGASVPGTTALSALTGAAAPSPRADCESFLGLLQLGVGLVLPTVLLVRSLPKVASARLQRGGAQSLPRRVGPAAWALFGGRGEWICPTGCCPRLWECSRHQLAAAWTLVLCIVWMGLATLAAATFPA